MTSITREKSISLCGPLFTFVRSARWICSGKSIRLIERVQSMSFFLISTLRPTCRPPLSLSVSLSLSLSFSLSTSLSPFISRIHARNAEDWAGNGVGHVYRHSETLLARFWAPSRNPLLLLQPLPRYREYVYTATINYAVMPGAIISKIDKTTDNLDRLW